MNKIKVFIMLLFVTGCQYNFSKYEISNLEELPDSISTGLFSIRSDRMLIAANSPGENRFEDTIRVVLAPRSCRTNVFYEVEIKYPVTICDRSLVPGYVDRELTRQFTDGARKSKTRRAEAGFLKKKQVGYKLSKWNEKSLRRPIFCSTIDGPWRGKIIETIE